MLRSIEEILIFLGIKRKIPKNAVKTILIKKIPKIVYYCENSAKIQSLLAAENPDIQSATEYANLE